MGPDEWTATRVVYYLKKIITQFLRLQININGYYAAWNDKPSSCFLYRKKPTKPQRNKKISWIGLLLNVSKKHACEGIDQIFCFF